MFAKQGGKARSRIKPRPAQLIDRAVAADHGCCLAVADHRIVFDFERHARPSPAGASAFRYNRKCLFVEAKSQTSSQLNGAPSQKPSSNKIDNCPCCAASIVQTAEPMDRRRVIVQMLSPRRQVSRLVEDHERGCICVGQRGTLDDRPQPPLDPCPQSLDGSYCKHVWI
jgi:hypothetical protein